MDDAICEKKWSVIRDCIGKSDKESRLTGKFIHYTSINSLFAILEGDSFWASNVRFSNDATEERMLKLGGISERDDYIICFSTENDMLSQWRGYCHNGGAAIKLNLRYVQEYSILHADYENTGKYTIYENSPLPVIYLNQEDNPENVKERIETSIDSRKYQMDISVYDILPYLKNRYFYEEQEARMVFSNSDEKLSKYIRFRTLPDGIKVPYIAIKHGNMGKMRGTCQTDVSQYNENRIKREVDDWEAIWIDEGYDQEKKYYEMINCIESYKTKFNRSIRVLCKGRLPVEEIVVAPTYDRERKAEQIKRFCQSKYWLKGVDVKVSNIPYIQPLL